MSTEFADSSDQSETPTDDAGLVKGTPGLGHSARAEARWAAETATAGAPAGRPGRNEGTQAGGLAWASLEEARAFTSETDRRRRWREAASAFERISIDRRVKGGVPTIRGTRITVAQICQLAADGLDAAQIVEQFYGQISDEDVREALRFAAKLAV